ncbi:tyrosine-type recombinase/integrase [Actinoplanes regularis]|uniref:tyrosine-type recombinase/integrase n=1 Tax=Actinoplanes regularis TaxID=52697 RepID=UPI0024A56ED0|nr:tyrosine-type recombinase/integrase [Actinoplanes regularis]GLW32235.1 integrase [Actinoplanes regularis]
MASRRGNLPEPAAALAAYLDSFDLCLRVDGKSPRTREMYGDIARWFAGWLTGRDVRRWSDVNRDQLRAFFLHLDELGYAKSYRNNAGRCLQAYFKWWSVEEDQPNPFDQVKPPPPSKMGEKPPPVIELEQLARLIKDAESGRDFASRRDAALLRMFAATGCRLSEITNLQVPDVSVRERQATVTGKGDKTRVVKFEHRAALALDRYLRKRAEHPAADLSALWIGDRRRVPMTPSGVRQVVERRGERLGMDIYPHLFRHTFSHNWLDQGGAEGDLMELNGWESPQMLRHYGSSARSARARRAYDRVDVMGGI